MTFWGFLDSPNPNLAEGDPLPIFLKSFYNNGVGKEAPEARAGSLERFLGRGAGAATKSLKIMKCTD